LCAAAFVFFSCVRLEIAWRGQIRRMSATPTILNFPEAELELDQLLGAGAFGTVWKCRVRNWRMADVEGRRGREDVWKAVKLVRQQDMGMAVEEAQKMQRAVRVARPDFVPMFWFCSMGTKDDRGRVSEVLGICMDCIDGTSLSTLRRHKEFNHRMACVVLKDLCCALGRLHRHGIVHNDVKDANILVTPGGECYLCDFGVSLFLADYPEGTEMPTTGTPHYMSPEIFFYDMVRYDTKVDVWALGIVGYELAVGCNPWQPDPFTPVPGRDVMFAKLKVIEFMDLSRIPRDLSFHGPEGPYARLLHRCFEVMPQLRASVTQLLDEFQWVLSQVGPEERELLGRKCTEARMMEASR